MSVVLEPRVHLSAIAGSGWLHTAPRYHQLMPISCHFQHCEALLFVLTTCKQRYIKYPGFTFFLTFLSTMHERDKQTCRPSNSNIKWE